VNGLHCLVLEQDDARQGQRKLLPLTKVRLVGTVVCAERRSNGAVTYVLDDGTGLVDCLHWRENPFDLPPLLDGEGADEGVLPVGSLVRILGRLECLSIHAADVEKISVHGVAVESPRCIREVHVSVMEELTATLDALARHWLACRLRLRSNQNAQEILNVLGPEIAAQVADRENLPAVDDMCGEWRLFGIRCRCRVAYKYALLCESVVCTSVVANASVYVTNICIQLPDCHCQATMEPLDPQLRFRDNLLEQLISTEKQLADSEPLRIQYKNICNDERLLKVASEVVGASGDTRRLLMNTIRALRKDGILYLLCPDSDTYLLISEARVLKPYIGKLSSRDFEDALEREALKKQRPAYLASVPKARVDLVKRRIFHEQRDQDESMG
jgi:hypothetical protein